MWWWLLATALVARAALAACPRLCECKWRSGKESAVCRNAGLDALPRPLDSGTQLLDLTGNRLAGLPDDAFAVAGLVNLQRIYLAECGLRTLRRHTFRNQSNLVELDLSRNRLETVPTYALADARELRELRLAGNPITKLRNDAFIALTQLVRLDLSGCRIADIDARAFTGLEVSLEFLELDNNKLRFLRAPTLSSLRILHGLELANNPWNCTCELRPLRDWMLRRNLPATIVPECAQPDRLAGQSWDRLDLDEFSCPPEVRATASHTSSYEGGEVTLACRVSGEPAPRVRWIRAGRTLANTTSAATSSGVRARELVLQGEGQVNRLIIRAADIQDAGSYICMAENSAGRAEASVTLAVERQTWGVAGVLGARGLLAGAVVAAVLVFGSCVLAVCAYDARRKRLADRWDEQIVTQSRRDDTYEKIEAEQKELEATRGSYRNVPSHDPEDETERHQRDNAATPISPGSAGVSWQPPRCSPRTPPACRWSLGPSAQAMPGATTVIPLETDLHIPRLPDFMLRDYRNESDFLPSTHLEFNNNQSSSDVNHLNNNLPTATAALVATASGHQKCSTSAAAMRLYGRAAPAHDRLDNDQSGSDSEKNYPDLIEMSALGTELYMRAERPQRPREPPDYAFCTLPRKRLPNVSDSTDSRSPLLPESRYGSSGGESGAGCGTLERRASSEWQHRKTQDSRRGRRSSSFLNLSEERIRLDSVPVALPSGEPTPPAPSATPLLDLTGLRAASEYARAADTADAAYAQEDAQYDLHATQLERFLQEYVTLREQLSKMKETRENLQRSRPVGSEQHDDFSKGNVKGRPSVAVTAASSSATSGAGDWMSATFYRTS